MKHFVKTIQAVAVILSAVLLLSVFAVSAYSADGAVTESDTYILNRGANGDHLYFYQSACVPGRSLNGNPGAPGSPAQIFIYTMYNPIDGDYIPAYCCDIETTAVLGSNYRRLNLEDSTFSKSASGMIRAILKEGFYLIPIDGETDDEHAVRANAKTSALEKAAGLPEGTLTITEAIAATQTAIWQAIHGADLEFHSFCRQSLVSNIWSSNTKYASLCNRNTVYHKTNDEINATIETVYKYLLSLNPVAAEVETVSPASFTDLNDPVYTQNADGTYNISVTATVDVDMMSGDTLTAKATLADTYTAEVSLTGGLQTFTLTFNSIPASYIEDDVILSVSGYQTSDGFYYFDAAGDRGTSQAMVGYLNSTLPVYAEVVAAEDRVLTINKSANVAVGGGNYASKPLANIAFDVFPVATKEEYESGTVILPDASDYEYPSKAEYILTTDENGIVSMNFLHYGLPDGIYLIVEHSHPSIVAPIEPFYLSVPSVDPQTGDYLYDIVIKPKNEVKGGVHIEKDVISVGNDEASVNAYDAHEWIIGTTIPEDIGSGLSYVITDTLDARLDFLGNVTVILEKNGEDFLTLTENVDYSYTVTDVGLSEEGYTADSFELELTAIGMSKISDAVGDDHFGNYLLRTYFSAQINENAEMGEDIPNRAELSYINAVNFEFSEKSDVPVVYTGGINLVKVDSQDKSIKLSGAVFELYRPATENEILTDAAGITEISGVTQKVMKVSFFDNAELSGEKVTSVTSGDDGEVAVYGLAYGTYYLTETKAPDGYNTLRKAVTLNINETSHTEQNKIIVENSTGILLPETGGVGTTVFTVAGALLSGGAVILLFTDWYTKKRCCKQ